MSPRETFDCSIMINLPVKVPGRFIILIIKFLYISEAGRKMFHCTPHLIMAFNRPGRLYTNRRTTRQAFCPPKPKELDMATRTFTRRGRLGT